MGEGVPGGRYQHASRRTICMQAGACGLDLHSIASWPLPSHATVECWEPGAGRWVELMGAMQQPRKYLGLAAAGGGWVGACGRVSGVMRRGLSQHGCGGGRGGRRGGRQRQGKDGRDASKVSNE